LKKSKVKQQERSKRFRNEATLMTKNLFEIMLRSSKKVFLVHKKLRQAKMGSVGKKSFCSKKAQNTLLREAKK
jgi:hypothetical protein